MMHSNKIEGASVRAFEARTADTGDTSKRPSSGLEKDKMTFLSFMLGDKEALGRDLEKEGSGFDLSEGTQDLFAASFNPAQGKPDSAAEFASTLMNQLESHRYDQSTQFQFVIQFPRWGNVAVKAHEYPAYWNFHFRPQSASMRQKILESESSIKRQLSLELGKDIVIDVE